MTFIVYWIILDNRINTVGIRNLGDNFCKIQHLKELDISSIFSIIIGNMIGNDGLHQICRNFKYIPELTKLKMQSIIYSF